MYRRFTGDHGSKARAGKSLTRLYNAISIGADVLQYIIITGA
jgi:hypothetical protein